MAEKKGSTSEASKSGAVVLSEEELTEVHGGTDRKRPPANLITWGKGLAKTNKSGSFSSGNSA